MKLQAPIRTPEGFKIALENPEEASLLTFDGSNWLVDTEWLRATDSLRTKLLGLLYESRNTLFKISPTMKMLETLLTPWVLIDVSGNMNFNCDLPIPLSQKDGKGTLELTEILIKQSGITPRWNVKSYYENTPVVDFEWANENIESDFREITLIDSEVPTENSEIPLQLYTDEEYNARKFAAKERVKEARLKAILSRRSAEVETQRFYNDFSLNDEESTFSEYDISDLSEEEEEEEET